MKEPALAWDNVWGTIKILLVGWVIALAFAGVFVGACGLFAALFDVGGH